MGAALSTAAAARIKRGLAAIARSSFDHAFAGRIERRRIAGRHELLCANRQMTTGIDSLSLIRCYRAGRPVAPVYPAAHGQLAIAIVRLAPRIAEPARTASTAIFTLREKKI